METAILVVDDDGGMRRTLGTFLSRIADATVIEAADGESSLRIARTIKVPVQLLISDIRLGPGIDGVQLARELGAISPEIKVILLSGDDTRSQGLPPEWRFVAKPFALDELIAVLSGLMPASSLQLDRWPSGSAGPLKATFSAGEHALIEPPFNTCIDVFPPDAPTAACTAAASHPDENRHLTRSRSPVTSRKFRH